jgi:hypothetical protein
MTNKRASVLANWMGLIDLYTLGRAFKDLTQEEFDWEPHPGAWGVRRRDACPTPNGTGLEESEWVSDNDFDLGMQEIATHEPGYRGEPIIMPMTTIGWLLNHFGAAPGLFAELTIVGGPNVPTQDIYRLMWGMTNIHPVDEAIERFQTGWTALRGALKNTTDDMLETNYEGHPWKRGDRALSAMLNEVSHHGTQICVLRDLFAHR